MPVKVKRDDSSLMHYGIKGQKKGQRRYEGYDGLLTPAGKERYSKYWTKDDNAGSSVEVWKDNGKYQTTYDNLGSRKTIGTRIGESLAENKDRLKKSGSAVAKSSKKILQRSVSKEAAKQQRDALDRIHADLQSGKLTPKQMQDYVNQFNLEQNYLRALSGNNPQVKTGKQKVMDFIDTSGDYIAWAAGAIGLAVVTTQLVKAIKNK